MHYWTTMKLHINRHYLPVYYLCGPMTLITWLIKNAITVILPGIIK